jgi:hypothetical protein
MKTRTYNFHNFTAIFIFFVSYSPFITSAEARLEDRIPHFQKRIASEDSNIRYCLLSELNRGSPEEKVILEKLCADPDPQVSNQALVHYLSNYVEVNKKLVETYLHNYYRTPNGLCLSGKTDVRSIKFHRDMVQFAPNEPVSAGSITCLGILGGDEEIKLLRNLDGISNPYVLNIIALALYRLDAVSDSIKAFEATLDLGKLNENFFYHIQAIRYVAQFDHKKAESLFNKLEKLHLQSNEINPGHVSSYYLLGWDLGLDPKQRPSEKTPK